MKKEKLSIVIPVYNEEKTITEIIKKVQAVRILGIEKEIIIVNDCSKDSSDKIIKNLIRKYKNIKYFEHKINKGKGAALRTGFLHATGDYVVIQDADLEYNPNEYSKLLEPILEGKTSVVYGSRFNKKNKTWAIPTHYIGNRFLSFVLNVLFLRNISDMETCYKCFTKKILSRLRLRENDFRIEPEITTQIIKKGFKLIEIPITYHSRGYDKGKKINWVDGIKALFAIVKYRFEK